MGCKTDLIAQGASGCVTVCNCGTVTIHCGNASMRISKAQFTGFSRMMDEAFANLAARELAGRFGEEGGSHHGGNPLCG